ncbi:MAG: sensor histidine kinase [Nitrososphaera sp.]
MSARIHSTLARQLAKANSELIEKDKLKDEFLKLASHELRTPIQPILGYSSLGVRGLVEDELAWKIVHKEAQRLMKLANNIVDITTIQSGVIKYNMEKANIMEMIQSAVDSIKASAKEKNLSLELIVDEKCQEIEIDADHSRLRRVFEELLENAVKFTATGSIRVECKIDSERKELLTRVIDTGTSIPRDILPRIFDIFASKSASDPTVQGAGLGLFICKAIVMAHGGTITAQNNSNGVGALFEVRFPINYLQEYDPRANAAVS